MHNFSKGMLIIGILLISSIFILGYTNYNKISSTSQNILTKPMIKKVTNLYVDPTLINNIDENQEIIVMFKSRNALINALSELRSRGIEILHVYKIINAIIVKASPKQLLDLNVKIFGATGLFANTKYYINFHVEKTFDTSESNPNTTYTSHLIGADIFWQNGYNGTGVKVAVIDTGINFDHPELQGKNYAEKSFVKKIYGYGMDLDDPSDGNGHGTFVAGVIAGRGIDPRGQGMAPGAMLMNARVFPPGGNTYATLAGIIAAIEWAAYGDDGVPNTGDEADVINLSLGGGQSFLTPTWAAIWNATKMGTIVVVAAGNDGDGGIYSMSIGDPANAPAAIAVGATNAYYTMIAAYSSFGPTILLSVKPEIVAPSEVVGVYYLGGYTDSPWAGTSFSSPHVAGAVALIVDYLNAKGIPRDEMPNLVRSLVMYSASDFYFQEKSGDTYVTYKYEDMLVGSGLLNLTNAYAILESSNITSTSYPQWLVILPKKIPVGLSNKDDELHKPYFPYTEYGLALGQELAFNFSITVSKDAYFRVEFYGNFTNALNIHSTTSFMVEAPVTYWEFNATVKENATIGYYSGYIRFVDLNNSITFDVPIEFKVYEPTIKILWDMKHTSWAVDYPYGQFRMFYRSLVSNGALINLYLHGESNLTVDVLNSYDLLLTPDTASVEVAYYENGTEAYQFLYNFADTEIDAIHAFIDNGGSLLLFAMIGKSQDVMVTNFTNINELLAPYGMSLIDAQINLRGNPVSADVVSNHLLVRGLSTLTHYGAAIKIAEPKQVVPLLEYSGYTVAAVYQNFYGGSVIVFGTNFIFDNWAFEGKYPGIDSAGQAPRKFVGNLVEFIANYTDLFNGFSISTYNVTRGGSVDIEVNLTRYEEDVRWCISNEYTEIEGSMNYDATTGTYKQTITFPIAGYNTLYIRVYVDEQTYVSPAVGLYVEKDENNPPTIQASVNNDTILTLENVITIQINITDDTGLILDSISITGNITQYILNMTIENSSDNKISRITINLNGTMLEQEMGDKDTISLQISIMAVDVNINTASQSIVFAIQKPKTEIPTIAIIAIVVVIVAILAAVAFLKFRAKE